MAREIPDFSKEPEVVYRRRLGQVVGTIRWLSGQGRRLLRSSELSAYCARDLDVLELAYGLVFVRVPCWKCHDPHAYVEVVDSPWRNLRCVACGHRFRHKGEAPPLRPETGDFPPSMREAHERGIAFLRSLGQHKIADRAAALVASRSDPAIGEPEQYATDAFDDAEAW